MVVSLFVEDGNQKQMVKQITVDEMDILRFSTAFAASFGAIHMRFALFKFPTGIFGDVLTKIKQFIHNSEYRIVGKDVEIYLKNPTSDVVQKFIEVMDKAIVKEEKWLLDTL